MSECPVLVVYIHLIETDKNVKQFLHRLTVTNLIEIYTYSNNAMDAETVFNNTIRHKSYSELFQIF